MVDRLRCSRFEIVERQCPRSPMQLLELARVVQAEREREVRRRLRIRSLLAAGFHPAARAAGRRSGADEDAGPGAVGGPAASLEVRPG
jgi:hypothetical protein